MDTDKIIEVIIFLAMATVIFSLANASYVYYSSYDKNICVELANHDVDKYFSCLEELKK